MRVTRFIGKDVLGLQDVDIECGKITTISGANAVGKSSVLEGIRATLGRGALGRLARVGAEDEPETVLVLDDGAVRVERSANKTRVKKRVGDSAAYEDVPRGQTFLSSLFDAELSNPVSFLRAAPKERVDLLLAALPIEVDWGEFRERIAWPTGMEHDAVAQLHPLEGLTVVRGALFEERTGVNRSAKDKASSAYELQKAIPANLPEDPAAEIEKLEARLAELRQSEGAAKASQEAREAEISGEFKAQAAKMRKSCESEQAAVRLAAEQECARLKAKADAVIESLRADCEAQIDAAESKAGIGLRNVRLDIIRDTETLATLRQSSKDAIRVTEVRRQAEMFQAEAEALQDDSRCLTEAINALDEYRRGLAKDLPIEGVEVRDREIFVEGIPYAQVNTSRQIRLAVEIATLRAKGQELPVLFVDGAEALDEDHFKMLVEELERSPAQVFLARVSEGPLRVEAS
jgi:hypothetical protein